MALHIGLGLLGTHVYDCSIRVFVIHLYQSTTSRLYATYWCRCYCVIGVCSIRVYYMLTSRAARMIVVICERSPHSARKVSVNDWMIIVGHRRRNHILLLRGGVVITPFSTSPSWKNTHVHMYKLASLIIQCLNCATLMKPHTMYKTR